MLGIKNAKIILYDKIIESNLLIDGKYIKDIDCNLPDNIEIIDAKGCYLSPGFIDLHTHGRGGQDFMNATEKAVKTISEYTYKTGVTSFLATTMTMPKENIKNAIEAIDQYKDCYGAKILGIHLEGPFFSKKYKGAQPESAMILPTVENYLSFVGNHQNLIRKISLAPELEHTDELLEYLKDKNTIVSVGHTDATFEQADYAYKHGAISATHTFNAMTPLTHRAPGVVGATMINDHVYAELIADGLHVSYPAIKVLLKTKGYDHVTIITDSLEAAGLPAGQYQLAGVPVFVVDGACHLENGTLAGSIAGMNDEIRNIVKNCDVSIIDAVKMASTNAAKSLKEDKLGEIKIDNIADLVIFDDDINIKNVIIDGKEMVL